MLQSKNIQEESVSPHHVEEHSVPNGSHSCIVCGMRYPAPELAEICCKKIAGIENLGGRRQHRWR